MNIPVIYQLPTWFKGLCSKIIDCNCTEHNSTEVDSIKSQAKQKNISYLLSGDSSVQLTYGQFFNVWKEKCKLHFACGCLSLIFFGIFAT